jgi:hypothetical protein
MDEKLYTITDLDGYVADVRQSAAQSLSEEPTNENLDNYISLKQMTNLVRNNCVGFDNDSRPLLNEDANEKIFEETAIWIHNVGLAKLAGQDLIECAWDSELNDMVFWAKEKVKKSNAKRTRSRRKNMGDQK